MSSVLARSLDISPRVQRAVQAPVRTITSESVSEGHPDKVCDFIADSILDAYLAADPLSRVACEVLCKSGRVILAGEITSRAEVDHAAVARNAIRDVGYDDPAVCFSADGVAVHEIFSRQAGEIGVGVYAGGAGDQGIMVGYATSETPELFPLPAHLAHAITRQLAHDRKHGIVAWLRPDAKSQVSVEYRGVAPARVTSVVVSAQHQAGVPRAEIEAYVRGRLLPVALGGWHHQRIELLVNPAGSFVEGGPAADSGLTGRKLIADTYGGVARHGGGAFSGKDPSKVDRSGAYFARYVARQLVRRGLGERVEVHVAYAIGRAEPVALHAETFGTGDDAAALAAVRRFDFRPAAMIERLDLRRPIYRRTTNYGHFGRSGLPWEDLGD